MKIDTRPTLKSTFQGFKDYGYVFKTAIPEFIDNAIASFRENASIIKQYREHPKMNFETSIAIIFDRKRNKLVIRDTAFGIQSKDFERSLRIGQKKEEQGGLNEFGKGLKTAAFWFGKNLEVITKSYFDMRDRGEYASGAKYSLLWKNIENDIATITPEKIEADKTGWKLTHGTVITVSDIYKGRMVTNSNAKAIIKAIASKYRRDIKNEGIKIYVYSIGSDGRILDLNKWMRVEDKDFCYLEKENLREGEYLKFDEEPLFIDPETKQERKLPINFSVEWEGKNLEVTGEVYQIANGSRINAGFDLFRRNRIIEENFDKFYPDKSGFLYQRVRGYLNIDNFPVTQTKDQVLWEGELFDKVLECYRNTPGIKEFEDAIKNYRVRAKNPKHQVKKIEKNTEAELSGNGLSFKEKDLSVAEKKKYELNDNDEVYDVKTEIIGEPITIIARKVSDNSMTSWMKIHRTDSERIYRVDVDVNHIFFNPFNDLIENGEFSKKFIKTMIKFSMYWVVAEVATMSARGNARDFRHNLADTIERNVKNNDNN